MHRGSYGKAKVEIAVPQYYASTQKIGKVLSVHVYSPLFVHSNIFSFKQETV